MSIRLKNELNALTARVEKLERAMNPSREPAKPKAKAAPKKAKVEGSEA